MQSEKSDNENVEAEPQREMQPQSIEGEMQPQTQTWDYALTNEEEIDEELNAEHDVNPDELEDYESSSGCVLHGLLEKIFKIKMDHRLCSIHHKEVLPNAEEGPIYNITSSKLQPPINRSTNYNFRNADNQLPGVYNPSSVLTASEQMPQKSSMSETNTHTFKQFPDHDKKEKMCTLNRKNEKDENSEQITIASPDTYLHLYFEPDHTIWAKISCSLKQDPDNTVYELKEFSEEKIIMKTENRSYLIINLPQLQDLEKKWLEGDPDNKAEIPHDEDLRSLYDIYLDIMLDPVKINLFRRMNNNNQKKEVLKNIGRKKCWHFPRSFDMSSVIKKDHKLLCCLTVGQNSVLPLKLKLNAYMHLNDFVQNCVLGLSHEEAKSKIWQSYEYGFLYDKLEDFYIRTGDCSLVHLPDMEKLRSSANPNFADVIKSCPFYEGIEDPIPSNNRVRFRCPKSPLVISHENEAKKYVEKAAKLKHLPFSEFVKEVAKLRAALPKSLQLPG